MSPIAFALGEFGEVGDGFGRVFFKQAADDRAFAGFEDGIGSGCAGHESPSGVKWGSVVEPAPFKTKSGYVPVGFFAAGLAAGLAAAAPPCLISMCVILTGLKGRLLLWALSMRAIFFTSSTVASSHWPKIV